MNKINNGSPTSNAIVIKARLGNDIRKTVLHNMDITYNELVLMLTRIFKGAVTNQDCITIKYTDQGW